MATPKRKQEQDETRVTKRRKPTQQLNATAGGIFQCFTVDGDDVNLHRRSAFTSERKAEVRGIRRKGACLRCRLLKRACSGQDPCKTCLVAANAAAGSRALMWMECIRPSFQAMNIFDNSHRKLEQSRMDAILSDLLEDDVSLDFHIPFALNVEAASAHLASSLCDDSAAPTFSVVGVFSCSTNTSLLQNALDTSLGKDLRLFVHLTTRLYTTGMQGGYQQYTDEEIQNVRDCVGNRLLLALDPLLRPSELEASEDKLSRLKSLFLLLLGTTVGMRYTCLNGVDNDGAHNGNINEGPKKDALLRLLCHYLIYIGKSTSLLDPTIDEPTLITRCKTTWNKPAAFTWNSSTGLEMHYRIQPPAEWLVSSSEDESMSNIDFDLSELDESDEFTSVYAEVLKSCSICDMVCDVLDESGNCQQCRLSPAEEAVLGASWKEEDSLPVSLSFDLDLSDPWDLSSSFDLSTPYEFGPLVALPSSLNSLDFSIPELAPDVKLFDTFHPEPLKPPIPLSWPSTQMAMPSCLTTSPHYTSEGQAPHIHQHTLGELEPNGTNTYLSSNLVHETSQYDPFQTLDPSNSSHLGKDERSLYSPSPPALALQTRRLH